MKNLTIREKAGKYGIAFWVIAEKLGISASTFSVWMRTELSSERRQRVDEAIDAIIAERR